MYESVHLVLDVILAIIAAGLAFRRDVLYLFSREYVMQKEWESVLGQMVLFTEEAKGKWLWECPTLDVKHDPAVRFSSQASARIAAATMIFALYVLDESTAIDPPPGGGGVARPGPGFQGHYTPPPPGRRGA